MRASLLLTLLALAGCHHGTPRPGLSAFALPPMAAIQAAAAAAPRGVPGLYEMRVAATGRQDGNLYLNSERDYRDQRNLTIAILPAALGDLRARLGGEPDAALAGKRIRVRGDARRVKIFFFADGRVTDKYYYQTHIDVDRADQIETAGRTGTNG